MPKPPSITALSAALAADAAAALALLTRVPVAGLRRGGRAPDLGRAAWAMPVIGLLVGAVGGLVYWAAIACGLGATIAAVWSLIATVALTGALHEDGLADVADGFGGGATRERKLEIMRDSRIGAYGALALALTCLLRVSAIAAIADPERVFAALCVCASLGRAGMLACLITLPAARSDGLAASMSQRRPSSASVGLALAVAFSLALLPTVAAAVTFLAVGAASFFVGLLARRQIGGHTGDVLGAVEVVAECAALTALVGYFDWSAS